MSPYSFSLPLSRHQDNFSILTPKKLERFRIQNKQKIEKRKHWEKNWLGSFILFFCKEFYLLLDYFSSILKLSFWFQYLTYEDSVIFQAFKVINFRLELPQILFCKTEQKYEMNIHWNAVISLLALIQKGCTQKSITEYDLWNITELACSSGGSSTYTRYMCQLGKGTWQVRGRNYLSFAWLPQTENFFVETCPGRNEELLIFFFFS